MRSKYMTFRYLAILLFLFALISCRNDREKNSTGSQPGTREMADLNSYFVKKDKERIENYIERKKLKMSESPTGLWYQIIREGEGKLLVNNDRIILDYECSLLDGTKCYSSGELGPKEVVLGRSEIEAGLNEGLHLLRPGGEAIFIIPPFLAYGLLGDRKLIPPRATLVYHVRVRR
jgi:FKBP-type peptidyl-prolyl cis-trans isomerase